MRAPVETPGFCISRAIRRFWRNEKAGYFSIASICLVICPEVGRVVDPHVPATRPSGAINTLLKFHVGANPVSASKDS
jgi:hypothetical protein